MPPIAHAVGCAACRVRCWWATHRPHCWLCHLLPAPPVTHAVSHHLLGAPSVTPLVARAVGRTTCCAIRRAICCPIVHPTCHAVGHAACCSTCHMHQWSHHSSCHVLTALPVAPSVVLP